MRLLSIVLSLVVTIAAAWEEFFRNGERWRHYRQIVEQLKSEGWLFFERSGPYAEYPSHARAHAAFVLRVEQILSDDLRRFVGEIAAEKKGAAVGAEKAKGGEGIPWVGYGLLFECSGACAIQDKLHDAFMKLDKRKVFGDRIELRSELPKTYFTPSR